MKWQLGVTHYDLTSCFFPLPTLYFISSSYLLFYSLSLFSLTRLSLQLLLPTTRARLVFLISLSTVFYSHTHTHTRKHAHTHPRTHTHTHTHTHTDLLLCLCAGENVSRPDPFRTHVFELFFQHPGTMWIITLHANLF